MEYLLHLLILSGIYVMLAQSLSLTAGYGGMLSLAHAGFYGVGAYTAALLSAPSSPLHAYFPVLKTLNISLFPALALAMLFCGVLALVVALIALRTIDDYFIICTLGIQVVLFALMNNCMELTKGPLGIPGIPSLRLFPGVPVETKWGFLVLTATFALGAYLLLRRLADSAFGRTLRALSEDEIFTQSIGKNVYLTKVVAFVSSAMLAAAPGVLYAHYISYIDPTSFTVNESIFILSIVIIGGMKNLRGNALAALLLVFLPEFLRFVGLPNAIAANLRQILYGAILIAIMFRQTQSAEAVLEKRLWESLAPRSTDGANENR